MAAALLTALGLLVFFSCAPQFASKSPQVEVELLPLALDARDPARTDFGAVIFLSGFRLRSGDARFGGLSGLSAAPDGRLYAVSDRGFRLSARMVLEPDGRLSDLVDWRIDRLLGVDGNPLRGVLADAEALARERDGSFLVAFEQAHRIWRYPPDFNSPPVGTAIPGEIARAPANGGLEALTVLPDGRLLAIAEEFRNGDGSSRGWLIDNGHFGEIAYVGSEGYSATDCAALKNGDVLVLERQYSFWGGLRARVKRVRAREISAGARLAGEELLSLQGPLVTENFEGIAVFEEPLGGTTIFLVSDNNHHPLQRTLLLQFRLVE